MPFETLLGDRLGAGISGVMMMMMFGEEQQQAAPDLQNP
jgi:hypothetical protein